MVDALRVILGAACWHLEDRGGSEKDLQKAKVTRVGVSSVCLLQAYPFAFKVSKVYFVLFLLCLVVIASLSLLTLAGPLPCSAVFSSRLVFPIVPHFFPSGSVNLSWPPSETHGRWGLGCLGFFRMT